MFVIYYVYVLLSICSPRTIEIDFDKMSTLIVSNTRLGRGGRLFSRYTLKIELQTLIKQLCLYVSKLNILINLTIPILLSNQDNSYPLIKRERKLNLDSLCEL